MQVRHVSNIPIILLGDMWPQLLSWLVEKPLKLRLLDREDCEALFLADTIDEAFAIIKECHTMFKRGEEITFKKLAHYRQASDL